MILNEDNLLRIYVGYDPREHDAYEVCKYSILHNTEANVEIIPVKQKNYANKIYIGEKMIRYHQLSLRLLDFLFRT